MPEVNNFMNSLIEETNKKDIYKKEIQYNLPKLLSSIDREFFSPTYGCFDRTFWQWKFIDYPNARFQEGVLSLALIYKKNFSGSLYFRKEKILNWCKASMNYWCKIMNKDGSFNEAYPNENCFVSTAFTLQAVTKAFLICKDEISKEEGEIFIRSFKKAGKWLLKNEETHGFISNHIAGAVSALYNLYLLTNEDEYIKGAKKKLLVIRKNQSKEGWLKEYEGADIGYQTLAIYYLASYFEDAEDELAFEILEKAIRFISFFVHPDGTIGGEYGFRNTEIYFPAGFEIMAKFNKKAAAIAEFLLDSINHNRIVSLSCIDTQNFVSMLNNYAMAYFNYFNENRGCKLPFQETTELEANFEEAGIFIKKTSKFHFIMNYKKGGIIKIFDINEKILKYSDCGYVGILTNGKVFTNQWFDKNIRLEKRKDSLSFTTNFYKIRKIIFTPVLFLFFRATLILFGRINLVSKMIKNRIVKTLIYSSSKIPLILKREIRFIETKVFIKDELKLTRDLKIANFYMLDKFSSIHMGSSKYFQSQELILEKDSFCKEFNIQQIIRDKIFSIQKVVNFEKE